MKQLLCAICAQIKKGFEDIQCAIGGQPVASYGDEFTVGVH